MGIASIGSMSGGAVWEFQVYGNSTGDIRLMVNPRDCFLAGVNYWEGNPNKKVQKVFANGPNSIYLGLIQLFYIKHSVVGTYCDVKSPVATIQRSLFRLWMLLSGGDSEISASNKVFM